MVERNGFKLEAVRNELEAAMVRYVEAAVAGVRYAREVEADNGR